MNKLTISVIALLVVFCHSQGLYVSIIDPRKQPIKEKVKSLEVLQSSDVTDVNEKYEQNICARVNCGPGEHCTFNESNYTPVCECFLDCESPKDDRQRICSSRNQTYESECQFHKEMCLCRKMNCDTKMDTLDYYGACTSIPKCTENQKFIFVERMKTWLDEVLITLSNRNNLNPKFNSLVKLASNLKQSGAVKYWTAGVIFEFCDLDKSKDHSIQKEELQKLISSIKSMEHCIQPFLDECDINNDGLISDHEWGVALDLEKDDMNLLRQVC